MSTKPNCRLKFLKKLLKKQKSRKSSTKAYLLKLKKKSRTKVARLKLKRKSRMKR